MNDFIQFWSSCVSCVALVTDHTYNETTAARTKVYLRWLAFKK